MGSASEGVMSHRHFNPAQEAETLEPKRHRRRRRQPKPLTGLHGQTPGGEPRPTDATHGNWERRNLPPLSVRRVTSPRRCQPEAAGEEEARRSQRLGSCPGYADVGSVCCKVKP